MGKHLSISERIDRNVDKSSGCWLWQGYINAGGYGIMKTKDRSRLAHRVYWEYLYGNIDSKLCVCHVCDTPSCVNPAHLFVGFPADNNKDRDVKGRHKSSTQTHCRHGHIFNEENTYYRHIKRNGKQRTHRHCRVCNRRRTAEYRRKQCQ